MAEESRLNVKALRIFGILTALGLLAVYIKRTFWKQKSTEGNEVESSVSHVPGIVKWKSLHKCQGLMAQCKHRDVILTLRHIVFVSKYHIEIRPHCTSTNLGDVQKSRRLKCCGRKLVDESVYRRGDEYEYGTLKVHSCVS